MHDQTISWNDIWILIFICLVGRPLLDPSASSFLIQMLGWIRGSSWVDSFIFLIACGSSLNRESLIFSCSHLLMSYYESSFFLCALFLESAESNQHPSGTHSLSEWTPWSWEAIPGVYNNLFFFFDCFVIASNTSFWCLQGWHMRDETIFNRIYNDSLGSSVSLVSL